MATSCSLLRVKLRFALGGRFFSSRTRRGFQLDSLPFTVSPDEAYKHFEDWATKKQGLGPLLSVGGSIGSATLTAAYTPYWYFSLNVRFVSPIVSVGGGRYEWKPEPFRTAYTNAPNGVVHIPGLASYAGFSYRRSLMDPVHNTTLVFKNESIVPFGSWMLEPLKYQSSTQQHPPLEIFPDPWNATRERALSIIVDELSDMSNTQFQQQYNTTSEVQIEVERLSSRRIYMPTYVVDYTILGVTYRAFISGCDSSIAVSGVSHKSIFNAGSKSDNLLHGASSFLSHRVVPMAASALQFFGLRPFIALGQVAWGIMSRIVMKFHIIGLLGGGAMLAWRKVVRPYMDDRAASAEWERQRDHEAQMKETQFTYNEFRDNGLAKTHYTRNQQRILRRLSGEEGRTHEKEGQEWYTQWEEWAKQQWEHAQRDAYKQQQEWQQQRGAGGHQSQQQRQQQQFKKDQTQFQKTKKREEYKWDFNPEDPYSVLGISRNASKDEVSMAFRREMLKHHPDTMTGATERDKRIATERSKLISDAYRKIKASQKR